MALNSCYKSFVFREAWAHHPEATGSTTCYSEIAIKAPYRCET